MTYQYDAFISYRHQEPDQSFARDLVRKLEAEGLTIAIDERDFQPSAKFLEEMERCVVHSRFTLALASPRYFESGNTQEESVICKVIDMDERTKRLIPLIMEPVKMPVWMYGLVGIDFTAQNPLVDPYEKLLATLRKIPDSLPALSAPPSRTIQRPWQLALAIILLLTLALLIWFYAVKPPINNPTQNTLDLAQRYLATGRYDEAGRLFAEVKGNPDAEFGAEKAALGFEITQAENVDMAKLGTKLDELLNKHKADADLQLLDGDRYYRLGQMNEARTRYLQALTNQPNLPEAHFRLGILSDLAGDSQAAAKHYDEAFRRAPDSPRYGNNLAYLALKQGQYQQAIQHYHAIDNYPLAKLEVSKAYWAIGEWDSARENQQQAIELLDNPDIANLPQNRDPWYFDTWDGKPEVHFKSWQEKHCYAELLLAATMALNNDQGLPAGLSPCTETTLDVKSAVAADLRHFVECAKTGKPEWEARSRSFRQSVLGSTNGTACQER